VSLWLVVGGLGLVASARSQSPGEGAGTKAKGEMNEATKTGDVNGNAAVSLYPAVPPPKSSASRFLRDFLDDEKEIWTSPKNIRFEDASWLVPLSGVTAGLFVTDADVTKHMPHDPKTLSHYNTFSNAGVAALIGSAGGMWVFSHFSHNEHWRETGFLAGEAAAHSLVMTEAFKYSFRRDRPYQGDGSGQFFQSGGTSFPSEHSAAAWSVAAVIAHEYPGPLSKILAYSAASLVSYSRVRAEKHFPSDVVIGALIGELAAHQVYTKHHDPELGGDNWDNRATLFYDEGHPRPGAIGSPYVPLDSWIYPAIDRLAAMGVINSAFAGMRPWTRLACAQMILEAQDRVDEAGPVASDIVRQLQNEFGPELGGGADRGVSQARLESVYARTENISGVPLTDGFHFGQTEINDYGRPYEQGWNFLTGFSGYATSGPWSSYVRAELQTAPSAPALPLAARQFISNIDGLPEVAPGTLTPAIHQFQLLDAYVGLTCMNWQLSFGRQSLDWGPGQGGSILFSGNAAPIDMFRISRVAPLNLPLFSRLFGPWRGEFFFGELTGHYFVGGADSVTGTYSQPLHDQPFLYGWHFTFKPTRNFEFGFSATTIIGGLGVPLTWGYFGYSLIAFHSNGTPGTPRDPGDRRSGLDWTYRLPLMRKWVTFYGDAFADDQLSPIAYWDRSAIRGGMYFSHIPKVSRLDLRVEGVYTDVPAGGAIGGGFYYFNTRFRNGYTNDGILIGSWIGRDGQGAQAWTNYWFSAKNRVQLYFRHQKVSQQFVPGGGSLTDVGTRADYWFRRGVGVTGIVQYERWLYPLIQLGPTRNVTASVQIQFQPQKILRSSSHGLTGSLADAGDAN